MSNEPFTADRRIDWGHIALILLLSVVYFFFFHQKMLAGPLRFNDDVVQHYLWLFDANWADDFYARASGKIQPWGYYSLLWLLSWVADPLTISRYGPLLTTVLTVGFGFGWLRKFFPVSIAICGALLVQHYCLFTSIGFLARAFCVPLLVLFGCFLAWQRPRAIAISLIVAALFYPPALLINGLILAAWELAKLVQGKQNYRHWRYYAGSAIVAILLVLLHSYSVRNAPELGTFFSAEQIRAMPEFHADGRVPFSNMTNAPTWWMMDYFIRTYIGEYFTPYFGMLVLAFASFLALVSFRKLGGLSAYLLLFALVTVGLYHAAKVLVPLLFLPDRYVAYPWQMGIPLVITFIGGALWCLLPRWWLAWLVAGGLLAVGWGYRQPGDLPVIDMADREPLHTHIRSLPEDVMIAAPPQPASWIPLLTQRSVLLSNESAHALYFRNYYDYVTPRFRDYTSATTAPADSLGRVIEFLDQYEVDYLLIDRRVYRAHYYRTFAPYKGAGPREGVEYALEVLPDSVGVSFGDRFLLVGRNELEGLLNR